MRRLVSSWTNTLTSLGFKRIKAKNRRQTDQRHHKSRMETLEERRMLAGDVIQDDVVRPEWVLTGWEENDTPEQFQVATEYTNEGNAVAVISLVDGLEEYDGTRQELTLELQLGQFAIATQEVGIDLAEQDFRDKFLAQRIEIARAELDSISSAEGADWLARIDATGQFTDLRPKEGAADSVRQDAIRGAAGRLAAIAKRNATSSDVLEDRGNRLSYYRAVSFAAREAEALRAGADSKSQDRNAH